MYAFVQVLKLIDHYFLKLLVVRSFPYFSFLNLFPCSVEGVAGVLLAVHEGRVVPGGVCPGSQGSSADRVAGGRDKGSQEES